MDVAKKSRWLPAVAVSGALASLGACASTVVPVELSGDGGTAFDGTARDAGGGTRTGSGRQRSDPDDSAEPDDDARDAGDAGDAGAVGLEDAAQDALPPLDCGAPGQLFTSPLGPFCPFQAGGTFSNCAVGEHCCQYAEVSATPSTCSAGPTACGVAITTGFDWRCDETNDCPGGQVCCFAGIVTPHPQMQRALQRQPERPLDGMSHQRVCSRRDANVWVDRGLPGRYDVHRHAPPREALRLLPALKVTPRPGQGR